MSLCPRECLEPFGDSFEMFIHTDLQGDLFGFHFHLDPTTTKNSNSNENDRFK